MTGLEYCGDGGGALSCGTEVAEAEANVTKGSVLVMMAEMLFVAVSECWYL